MAAKFAVDGKMYLWYGTVRRFGPARLRTKLLGGFSVQTGRMPRGRYTGAGPSVPHPFLRTQAYFFSSPQRRQPGTFFFLEISKSFFACRNLRQRLHDQTAQWVRRLSGESFYDHFFFRCQSVAHKLHLRLVGQCNGTRFVKNHRVDFGQTLNGVGVFEIKTVLAE